MNVVHLDDVLLRRTALAFRGGLSRETLEEVAAAIARPLGWNAARRASEVERAEGILASLHRVSLDGPGLAPLG